MDVPGLHQASEIAHERRRSLQHVVLSVEPAVARRQLEMALTAQAWGGDIGDVLLAVSEALVNAAQHAGGARRAEAWLSESSVVVRVCDRGPSFDPAPYVERPPDVLAERGRGVWLMSRVADACEAHVEPDGGSVVLRFDRDEHRTRRDRVFSPS
jgi:anti-sigma regulatory factor (Ser/Thr protein kinase)